MHFYDAKIYNFIMQKYGKTLNDDRFFPIFFNFALKINTIMKYLVAKFSISPNSEEARDLVAWAAGEAGFESFEETTDGLNGYVQTKIFDENTLKSNLEDLLLPNVEISFEIEEMEDKDWNETWEEAGFEPISIENKCIIFDTKQIPTDKDNYAIAIQIDAKQAFGTGTHETTRMIVEQLLCMDMSGKHILDCGCGTGILSIVASKCGASSVFAYDIDDWSVRNTKHNAEINNVSNIDVAEGDVSVIGNHEATFDIAIANINRNILLADMPHFAKSLKSEGHLILSGFYEEDADMLICKAEELGLHKTSMKTTNNWCMIVLKK